MLSAIMGYHHNEKHFHYHSQFDTNIHYLSFFKGANQVKYIVWLYKQT
jgi:hypothetical protein